MTICGNGQSSVQVQTCTVAPPIISMGSKLGWLNVHVPTTTNGSPRSFKWTNQSFGNMQFKHSCDNMRL